MPLESTIICVDNSEFMRNGDYIPNRLQAQQDAVNTVCRSKLMANPENNVGLLTLAKTQVLATLTTDGGRILTSLHKVQPSGLINFLTGIRIAHLALKHRQSKNHKMRIVVFVGSPIKAEEKDIVKIAKRLKKENVLVDIINFGETDENKAILETFINTINGREGTGSSHLVTIPPSPHLSDALLSSPIIQGEEGSGSSNFTSGGGGFDFGVDPNEDPELALALRVSMEEQRQRQQEEEKQTPSKDTDDSKLEAAAETVVAGATRKTADGTLVVQQDTKAGVASDEEMLQQALAMSLESGVAAMEEEEEGGVASSARVESTAAPPPAAARSAGAGFPDFSTMTEEEQIAYAMQISLQGCQSKEEPMDVDDGGSCSSLKAKKKKKKKEEEEEEENEKAEPDFSHVMSDPAFLQGVLQSLPGVDPESKVVRQAVGSLVGGQQEKSKGKNKEDEKAKDKGKKNKEDNDK